MSHIQAVLGLRTYEITMVPSGTLGCGYHIDYDHAEIRVSRSAPAGMIEEAIIVASEYEIPPHHDLPMVDVNDEFRE
jgi:hypothetical protein